MRAVPCLLTRIISQDEMVPGEHESHIRGMGCSNMGVAWRGMFLDRPQYHIVFAFRCKDN